MTVILTPFVDLAPVPRVGVQVESSDVPVGTDRVTLWRSHEGREFKVRDGVDRTMVSAVSLQDMEAPPGVTVTYEAECWDGLIPLGRVALGATFLDFEGTVVQQPLDPSLNAVVEVWAGTGSQIRRPSPGEVVATEGAVLPTFVGFGPRAGLVGFQLNLGVSSANDADKLQATLGTYINPQLPVLLFRTSLPGRIPRMAFFHVADLVETDVNVQYGGGVVVFSATVTEVKAPAQALVVAPLTYDDLDVSFVDYDVRDAAYPSYDAMDADWSLAGAAG